MPWLWDVARAVPAAEQRFGCLGGVYMQMVDLTHGTPGCEVWGVQHLQLAHAWLWMLPRAGVL